MKKSILIPVILLLALSSGMAQQTELGKLQYLISPDVPMEVLAAVEADYPGMNILEHFSSPSISPKKELIKQVKIKSVAEYDAVYYAVIKGRDYRKTADYNKQGKLISSSETIKNIAVPRAVLTTIGREYNGWLMTKNQAERYTSSTYSNVFYEVWLKNGRKKQQLTLNATGLILSKKRPEY